MSNHFDVECMSLALRLARYGRYTTRPNPNVGCVITNADNKIVGTGYHVRAGEAHAEINALKQAGKNAHNGTAYVSLEPCCYEGKTGPCTTALIEAEISRVVIAMCDPNPLVSGKGIEKLREKGIQVDTDLMHDQAKILNRGFVKRMTLGLPWVTVKMASSLDGRTALSNGKSKWITSEMARKDVQMLRAQYDAIMTGVGTVLADNPSLNVRISNKELGIESKINQPHRIILDSSLQFPKEAKMLSHEGETWIFTTKQAKQSEFSNIEHCKIFTLNENNGKLDLKELLQTLAKKEINSVLIEAGPKLVGSLLKEGLVDEWISYVAPKFLGNAANGMLDIGELQNLDESITLECNDIRQVGSDIRITSLIKH